MLRSSAFDDGRDYAPAPKQNDAEFMTSPVKGRDATQSKKL